MSRPAISVLVRAGSGAAGLAECLASVPFATERVVITSDPGSQEASLARSLGARVVALPDDPAVDGDWVLELGADMQVPPPLADEILAAVGLPGAQAYAIAVRNLVGGRPLRHGWTAAMLPAVAARLRRRTAENMSAALLRTPVDRRVGRNISDLLRRLDRETTEAAARSAPAGSLASACRACCCAFLASYLGHGGFREGRMGLVLAICAALAPVLEQTKATLEHRT